MRLQPVGRAEEEVLGCILVNEKHMDEVAPLLAETDFCLMSHRTIYQAMMRLYEKNNPISIVTVTEFLDKSNQLNDVGGVPYLAQLSQSIVTTAQLEYYIKLVKEHSVKQRLLKTLMDIQHKTEQGNFENVEELLDYSEQQMLEVRPSKQKGLSPVASNIIDHLERIEETKHKGSLRGLSWGFPHADRLTGGLCKGQLIILAARPAVGKSAMMMTLANQVAIREKKPVGIFSLEMSEAELVDRSLSMLSQLPLTRILNNTLNQDDWVKLTNAADTLHQSLLSVDDTPGITLNYIAAQARKLKREHGEIGLILIDYLQLMDMGVARKNYTRDQEIGVVTRRAKQLAKELESPIVMLCQLSREVEKRADKKPQLSDLRESGNIENDADVVAFLHPDPEHDYSFGGEPIGRIDLIIAKCRNGSNGRQELAFRRGIQTFIDWQRRPFLEAVKTK